MKVYASTTVNGQEGWGDGFPALFCAQVLKAKYPDMEFSVYDGGSAGTGHCEAGFRHRDYIAKPAFVSEWLDAPPVTDDFDAVLATHFMHPFKGAKIEVPQWLPDPQFGGYLPPATYTTRPKIIRMHSDRACAQLAVNGFIASADVLAPPELPGEPYIVVQLRREDIGKKKPRNAVSGTQFDAWAQGFIDGLSEQGKPIILISDQIDGGINGKNWTIWQKIHAAQHAERVYVAHSGFGMVLAMYAGRTKTSVINASLDGAFRNPCLGVFGNVDCEFLPQQPSPYVSARYELKWEGPSIH